MCTVTWIARPGGYDLFFNRDELNVRAAEAPPEVRWSGGLACVAPTDGARGGTWLAANSAGLTVCLLNDYGAAWRPVEAHGSVSRGHLVTACATAVSLEEVATRVQDWPLALTRPFHLLALLPEGDPLMLHWQGLSLVRRSGQVRPAILTSSSFSTAAVTAARLQCHAAFVGDRQSAQPAVLAAYHRQHDCAAGAQSVLMRRTDAATRSIIHVNVNRERVRLDYEPVQWGPGGQRLQPPTRVEIPRYSARAAFAA